ncbi:hypothetical protein BFX83_08245 [Komagataeibacter xylinus]|nr:hypothetical protein BFX83_08245 [Komagataeibacter xylinus]
MADNFGRDFGSCRFYFHPLLQPDSMFRLLILALACLPFHHAMAQMPGAVPGGWNGSVALPHASAAPPGLSMPSAPPLAHFAPLPGSGSGSGLSGSMSLPAGLGHGQADERDMSPSSPMTDNDARQDWNAFRRAEQQVLRDMRRPPAP